MCDERRNEFVLLSDTLGLSAVVDEIANRGKRALLPNRACSDLSIVTARPK